MVRRGEERRGVAEDEEGRMMNRGEEERRNLGELDEGAALLRHHRDAAQLAERVERVLDVLQIKVEV